MLHGVGRWWCIAWQSPFVVKAGGVTHAAPRSRHLGGNGNAADTATRTAAAAGLGHASCLISVSDTRLHDMTLGCRPVLPCRPRVFSVAVLPRGGCCWRVGGDSRPANSKQAGRNSNAAFGRVATINAASAVMLLLLDRPPVFFGRDGCPSSPAQKSPRSGEGGAASNAWPDRSGGRTAGRSVCVARRSGWPCLLWPLFPRGGGKAGPADSRGSCHAAGCR